MFIFLSAVADALGHPRQLQKILAHPLIKAEAVQGTIIEINGGRKRHNQLSGLNWQAKNNCRKIGKHSQGKMS